MRRFTLIELIMVVALIAVAASALAPRLVSQPPAPLRTFEQQMAQVEALAGPGFAAFEEWRQLRRLGLTSRAERPRVEALASFERASDRLEQVLTPFRSPETGLLRLPPPKASRLEGRLMRFTEYRYDLNKGAP